MANENLFKYYFDLRNHEISLTLSNNIVTKYKLNARENIKDYGHLKTDSDYAESFLDWNKFKDDFLLTAKKPENPMYTLFRSIYHRCYNPNSIGYAYYGEIGIHMDSEWKNNFSKFAKDILNNLGRKPERFYSIDRIDQTGNYVLNNIRWSAPVMQNRNKSSNKVNEINALTLARLYKYFDVTGRELMNIYNDELVIDNSQKITKGWNSIYTACRSYCKFV